MADKYISKTKKIGHCPHCRGVVFKDFKRNKKEDTSFLLRCPHCQKDVLIKIRGDVFEIVHPS